MLKKHFVALKIKLFKFFFKKEIENILKHYNELEKLYWKNKNSIVIESFRYRFFELFISLGWYRKK